ncbi:hypothetical protein SCLCIDRAFT_18956 [Scleroderma citrinum Foug A]|uniref:Non-haem dioxygenase N-terminal domain-containing protein n=1 Tax=Scleroderma citrinum Foug A TaxID=1036808 RepID=A0A0C3A899_9AGAM|nr:hypothetical protein SCLCIDRAFT_18956 [Scleroderma citrinum Foug A]
MSLVGSAAALDGALDSIPVINIGDTFTPERRAALAHEMLAVTGHGIPQEIIDNLLMVMEAYFSLPLETKMKLFHREFGSSCRGYAPPLNSNVDPANRGDLHEAFAAGLEEQLPKESDEKGANVWPSEPTGFREAYLNYCHAAAGVGKLLFHLFALALDLPETYFEDKSKNSATFMRTIHYPLQTSLISDDIVGVGAHSDAQCFTILWQQPGIQALQVLNLKKQWIDAMPIPVCV